MNGEILTAHAQQRLAQRCVSTTDLEWALRLGREVEGGFLILKKDAEAAARELERLAEHVRRLSGLRIVARPMLNNSAAGDAIYEPFSGSGSTIVAAETTGRRCYAVELDPRYVDVTVLRWQALTGKAAVLVGEDRTFGDLAAVRAMRAAS